MNKKDFMYFMGIDETYAVCSCDCGDSWSITLDTGWVIKAKECTSVTARDSMFVVTFPISDCDYKDVAIPYENIKFIEFVWGE